MPKENTHLYFARELLDSLVVAPFMPAIMNHQHAYLLGAVIPDTCYYGTSRQVISMSENIHGKDGRSAADYLLALADNIADERDLALILGSCTHCALDVILHLPIGALCVPSGDGGPDRKIEATRMHNRLETALDASLGHSLRVHRLLRSSDMDGSAFTRLAEKDFALAPGQLKRTFKRQLFCNRLFVLSPAWQTLQYMLATGMISDRTLSGLFYADARALPVPGTWRWKDPEDDSAHYATIGKLFARASQLARDMMRAMWDFTRGDITRERLQDLLPAETLDTGTLPKNQYAVE